MLDHPFNPARGRGQLTLKSVPHRNQISRLLPCGKLKQKGSAQSCTVFLKRSRNGGSQLLEPLQKKLTLSDDRAPRRHRRRGSFLRLPMIRNQ